MNGFEVTMIDSKGFGFTSGTRGGGILLEDSLEQIGLMLQMMRKDRPLFVICHSMGCLNMENFLINNPQIKVAGVIYTCPFFEFPIHNNVGMYKKFLALGIKTIGEFIPINTILAISWLSHCKYNWRACLSLDHNQHPMVSGGSSMSMMHLVKDVHDNSKAHTVPFCLLLAERDKIVNNAGAIKFYSDTKMVPAKHKVIKRYLNGYHNLW